MIIAIDFDGTIVDNMYPHIGKMRLHAPEVINQLHKEGHDIIIWTCRTGKELEEALLFLDDNNIWYDYVNENSTKSNFQPYPKIYYDFCIDDRSLGGIPEDWYEIYGIIKEEY
jgi:hydroxymethylpyrimidine pyrophosphatase-like HAD family hydrolase